ncbi:MAG: DNA primase [Candidatus Peregrinibacteria bacterium]|nr:DNA primase [Candidatus Peregrinibacteria bacterium]
MDDVSAIKAKLSIEELVSGYTALTKKGRNFVARCPFHNDTHPSFIVSPDKGIAWCFACQNGGDIFSIYQKMEGVDFPQAVRDLAERTGVTLVEKSISHVNKDERTRARECLEVALTFYREQLTKTPHALQYIEGRRVPVELQDRFEIGYAPDSFSQTYEHLLKRGFSRKEILSCGLGVQKELRDERIYDRFRNRLLFPIRDVQGALIGFGGRTLGNDDAKYLNTQESILYHKSAVLFGLSLARESMREKKEAFLVEGYFDVLALHKCGIPNAVAVSGTALTEQHAKLLKRYVTTVVLCLDQDAAGEQAAERAFTLLSTEGLVVETVTLPKKDPDEIAREDPALLTSLLTSERMPYMQRALSLLELSPMASPAVRRDALLKFLSLVNALPLAVEREEYINRAAGALGTSTVALKEDLDRVQSVAQTITGDSRKKGDAERKPEGFSKMEIALGLFFLYPSLRPLLSELIEPDTPFEKAVRAGLLAANDGQILTLATIELPEELREHLGVLLLFLEQHGFAEWSESLAYREVKKNCIAANREILARKQHEIAQRLMEAKRGGRRAEEEQLTTQYQQVLKLTQMVC